ncbi:uncharacterized protein CDAR_248771 [Caerostris darwini]|uniref:Uncharacterized protein n=1 Tax=Caerostris darwini TaxID=1538125 RepID=A0AAV4UAU0_9ARAC|nr:uncharacterized protein CDAR_248771 [Caerostris darwini]
MTPVKITFSQILFGDESMPFQDCDDDSIGECSQSFLENSQFFEDLMQSFQSGGGISDAELNDAVIVLEKSRRKNKKYQAEEVIFKARVDPERLPSGIAGVPLDTIIGAVRQLFLTIIERATETLAPTDLIRFYIQDDHPDPPISTTIMPVSDLTIEKILTEILKVLQSKKSIQLDSVLR